VRAGMLQLRVNIEDASDVQIEWFGTWVAAAAAMACDSAVQHK
jgi:hypothetical protein